MKLSDAGFSSLARPLAGTFGKTEAFDVWESASMAGEKMKDRDFYVRHRLT